MFGVAGIVLVVVVLWTCARRANEVFCLSVRDGRSLVVRGRIPLSLRQDLVDVLQRGAVRSTTLRAVRQSQRAVLLTGGINAELAQRLRNVFDSHQGPRLGLARGQLGQRNLGQRLGWVWLAWWCAGRSDEQGQ